MRMIDPKATTTQKALCPFCSYGCEFGVVFNDFGIKGVDYLMDGSSGGRLCPRGSAAGLYLDHPRRLSTPLKNGKATEWSKILKEMQKVIETPTSVAVTFDRNVTIEEYESVLGFCEAAGIKHVASSYLEPEIFLREFLQNKFSEEDIESSKYIVVLGDPFSQAPMSSKALISWKLGSRDRRLVVIDSIGTHTASFASHFLRVAAGTEPLLLLSLAQNDVPGVDLPAVTGIPAARIKEISDGFRKADKGLIIACLPIAHTHDPLLVTEALRLLSDYSKKRVVPFVEFAGYNGPMHFAGILELARKKKIKHLINFGELFPFYYPQILSGLKNVDIYATSPFKYDGYATLPAALNLEKAGSIMTNFGTKRLSGHIKPPSGVMTINEMLSTLKETDVKSKKIAAPKYNVDIRLRAEKIAEARAKKHRQFWLMGEKIAYYFLGFFEREKLKIHPVDAAELGLRNGDVALIESARSVRELPVALSTDVSRGIVTVPTENPDVRGLFDYNVEEDNQIINFVPTEVQICRKG